MKCKIIVVGLTLLILLFPDLSVMAQDHGKVDLEKMAAELNDLIMCPLCAGQTIGQSNSDTSTQMRNLVLKKLRQGETKDEILQYFASRYGERVLATPVKKGLNLTLWFFPGLFVIFAAIVIYFLVRRWSTRASVETVNTKEEALLDEYKERLEKELKDFDEEV